MAVRAYYTGTGTYTGLTTGLSAEELTLVNGNGPGDPMWPGGNPEMFRPGGNQVDPRRIRVFVYPGGQCVNIGNVSRGNMAFMIVDCQQPLNGWMYGSVPTNFQPGVYYGTSRSHLGDAESEIVNERPTAYDQD